MFFQNSCLFSCASVAAACKLTKTAIDKVELLALSKAKRAVLAKVTGDIIEIDAAKNSSKKPLAQSKPKNTDFVSRVLAESEASQFEKSSKDSRAKKRKTEQDEEDDFEAWKREMLKKAGAACD